MSVARRKIETRRILPPADGPFRLRLGPGVEDGFLKLGPAADTPDHVVDTRRLPWPVADGVVDTISAKFYFHRLTKTARWAFMDEAYRVLKPGGQLILVVPHWSSMRAITDPEGEWPPLCESSFMVYSAEWRQAEQMTHLPITANFGGSYGYGHALMPAVALRNDEFQQHAKLHLMNAITDLHVTLTKPLDA